jgi:hypothetical protein
VNTEPSQDVTKVLSFEGAPTRRVIHSFTYCLHIDITKVISFHAHPVHACRNDMKESFTVDVSGEHAAPVLSVEVSSVNT